MDGPLRNLTHLASDLWHHLVQKTLHHGLAKNWFTVTKHFDEACWLKKYDITSIGCHEKETRDEHVNVVGEEQVIEIDHIHLRYVVDETVLSILAESRGPMQRSEIKEHVMTKLQGIRIRENP